MTTQLEAIRKRAEAATKPTVWGGMGWSVAESDDGPGAPPKFCIGVDGVGHYPIGWIYKPEDAEFIAHAREDIPALLAALAEKDRVIERLSGALEPLGKEAKDREGMSLGPDIDHWPIGFNQLTLGDLRRASETLASLNQASDRPTTRMCLDCAQTVVETLDKPTGERDAVMESEAHTWTKAAQIIEAQDGMSGWKRRIAALFRDNAIAALKQSRPTERK